MVKILHSYILDAQGQLTGCRVWWKIQLIQAFMGFLVTCKNEEDPFMRIFYDAKGQLTPQSDVGST